MLYKDALLFLNIVIFVPFNFQVDRLIPEMLNSAVRLAALVALSNGFKLRRQDASYHYMAIDYDYGYDSRVTANLTFGTEPNAPSIQTVMDTGSANFWVFFHITCTRI